MVSKKMAVRVCKASVIVFVLCFTVVQLASLGNKNPGDLDPPHHLKRDDSGPDKLDGPNVPAADHVLDQKPVDNNSDNKLESNVVGKQEEALRFEQNKQDQALHFEQKQDQVLRFENKPADSVPVEDVGAGKVPQLEKPVRENQPLVVPDVNEVPDANKLDSQIEEPVKQGDQDAAKDKDEDEDDKENDEDEDEEEEDDAEFPAHKLVDKLSLAELVPPDHMDAVRLEQDGHLNREYKREIIIGNHEEFEQQQDMDPEELLTQIFDKVDKDHDHQLTLLELEEWIIDKVQEHFAEARDEAARIFKHLDTDNKGKISWQNFHIHFLVAKGHDLKTAKKHASDYETIALDPDDKERLIRYKFRWAEADEEPQDNILTIKEFMAFRHPEQSPLMIDRMVQDILDSLDTDTDGEVTEEEFIALPPGEVDGGFAETDKAWQEERRKEYRMVIDIDHDGKVSRDELRNYVDPQNPNHGRLEADNLIQLADQNGDLKLSLEEVLSNMELFLGSKMVDTGRNFHDEF